jgi:hypothetical protein
MPTASHTGGRIFSSSCWFKQGGRLLASVPRYSWARCCLPVCITRLAMSDQSSIAHGFVQVRGVGGAFSHGRGGAGANAPQRAAAVVWARGREKTTAANAGPLGPLGRRC